MNSALVIATLADTIIDMVMDMNTAIEANDQPEAAKQAARITGVEQVAETLGYTAQVNNRVNTAIFGWADQGSVLEQV